MIYIPMISHPPLLISHRLNPDAKEAESSHAIIISTGKKENNNNNNNYLLPSTPYSNESVPLASLHAHPTLFRHRNTCELCFFGMK